MKLTEIKQALKAYQTGHYPKHGDASRTLETLTKALPHLIAIAEAAGTISRYVGAGQGAGAIVTAGECASLWNALKELEKA